MSRHRGPSLETRFQRLTICRICMAVDILSGEQTSMTADDWATMGYEWETIHKDSLKMIRDLTMKRARKDAAQVLKDALMMLVEKKQLEITREQERAKEMAESEPRL